MTLILRVLGIAALLMGLLWMGQGSGLIMWPASSFMLEQKVWILWGGVLASTGAGLLFLAQRRR